MISGGWNSQKDTIDTKNDPWLVLAPWERTEVMPFGWNIKKEARNSQPFQSARRRKKLIQVDRLFKGTPSIPNIILALLKITWKRTI